MLGSDSRKSIKKLDKMADKIVALAPTYEAMSDDELKNQTVVLKERLKSGETVDDILFDAFAAVKEASFRVLRMKHYKVQLMGGICLHQGRVAEMKTGEGKTLVATLAAYLNALLEKGVHIVTVNEYLARRDAEWMGKIYRFMGLSVGVVVPGMNDDDKRDAYKCDITYATNNELGFDYLRDNLKIELDKMVQRELFFGIVDEVDSILIDEARTPLIISGRGEKSSDLYVSVNRFVKTLKEETDFTVDYKEKSVQITEDGSAKAEKFFNIENLGDVANADINHHIQQALKANCIFKKDNDYIINDGEIIIVDEFTGRLMIGRRYSDGLHQAIEAKEGVKIRNENKTYATITFQNFFRLYPKLSGMTGTAKTEEGEFRTIYSLDVLEIPTNAPLARKDLSDAIYATINGKQKAIIKEIEERNKTGQPILVGTVTVEKSEDISKLLKKSGIKHNILNAKNHEKEAEIIAQAGRFGSVTIATNMAGRGTDILLGGNPEYLAKKELKNKGIEHDLIELATSYASDLNDEAKEIRDEYQKLYKQYKEETDAEKQKVVEAGGLHILGTERHESRRIDNQLRGRAGRQGDAGSSIFFISLEDDLAKRFGGERMQSIYNFFKVGDDECLQAKMLSRGIENAQRNIEGRNFGIRKHILQYDDVMNKQREVIYAERMKVLKGEDVHGDILKLIPDYVDKNVSKSIDNGEKPEKWDLDLFNKNLEDKLFPVGTNFMDKTKAENWDYEYLCDNILEKTIEFYEEKIAKYKENKIDFSQIERIVLLKNVDNKWIDHIDAMDQLRKGIGLRAYGNVDPVISYKQEGFEMFDDMIERIQEDTISVLLKGELERVVQTKVEEKKDLVANNTESKPVQAKASSTVGRNEPCPCGSGKKYKNCCGK
jgi:preprotein translocase subunit SecA